MSNLKWDGDDEGAGSDDDSDGDVELEPVDEGANISETPDDDPRTSKDPIGPSECEHPWQEVTQETMKRSVRGSTIDTKKIYWCDSCKTILDVIE